MAFDADLTACAALVERADPDRFRAVMAAPVPARRVLFPLYAMNIEVARAPWVTSEPLIAEMRLQWWADALGEIAEGGPVRRHEVTTPLAAAIDPGLVQPLAALVEARRRDIARAPFEDAAALDAYIEATSGNLLWVAARALGAADESVVRDAGYAQGLANWLRAVPELVARGRAPLVESGDEALRDLAQRGLDRLARARAARRGVSAEAAPAMLAVWPAGPILHRARRNPDRVGAGGLAPGPAGLRVRLALRALSGRW